MPDISPVYGPRNPHVSQYYQCVEDHFDTLEQVYDERFAKQYGFFRPYVRKVIYRYLDCGILHNGFARVKCENCNHEYLLAFSCKRRQFCPSCHQKRVVEFGEWLCEEVLKAVPHRHFTFSIPKILRRYFLYDRKLLSDLSRCGWEALKAFYTTGVRDSKAVPGAVVAIQTFGDFPLGFHPHLHILVSDGSFHENGMFSVSPSVETKTLEQIFRHKVFKMLLSKEKITEDLVDMIMKWRHSGFNVFCGPRIQPGDQESMENLARYTCPPQEDYPRLFLAGEDDLYSGRIQGCLPIEGRQRGKDFRCLGVVSRHVLSRPEQGGTDGPLLWPLQQRGAGQAQKERAGRADTCNPGTRWLIRGIQTKLGASDTEDLRSGPLDVPQVPRSDENFSFYRTA